MLISQHIDTISLHLGTSYTWERTFLLAQPLTFSLLNLYQQWTYPFSITLHKSDFKDTGVELGCFGACVWDNRENSLQAKLMLLWGGFSCNQMERPAVLNPNDRGMKWNLRTVGVKTITSLQLLKLMYLGYNQVGPSVDTSLAFGEDNVMAKAMDN